MSAPLLAQQAFAEWPRPHLPGPGGTIVQVWSLDADGDGDQDVLGLTGSGTLELWANDGEGVFTPGNGLVPTTGVVAVAVADFNRDGLADLAIAAGGQSRLLVQTGTGVFAFQGSLPLSAAVAVLAALDADGDGDQDLFVSGGIGALDQLLLNQGNGQFQVVTLGSASVAHLLLPFDADGDGDQDMLVGGFTSWQLLLNDGTGVFSPGAPLPGINVTAACGDVGDVDGDQDLDLVVGVTGGFAAQDRLLLNQGNGVFVDATAGRVPTFAADTTTIDLLDLDADGDLDVLAGFASVPAFVTRRGFTAWLNDGAGRFAAAHGLLPANDLTPGAVAIGDFDRDGDPDVVFSVRGRAATHLYWNDRGPLVHATAAAVPFRNSYNADVAVGDLDGDGLPEVAAVGWNFQILSSASSLLANDGTGNFAEAAFTFPLGLHAAVAFADIDGDGDRDIALAPEQGTPMLFANDGALQFRNVSTQLPPTMTLDPVLAFVDFDADGDQDLLLGSTGSARLFANGGTGTFTDVSASMLPLTNGGIAAIAVGDVDGDGDPDVVLAGSNGSELLRNRGGSLGFVGSPASLPPGNHDTRAVALADLDGDGDRDLLLGNAVTPLRDPRSWLLLNDGSGGFTGSRMLLGSTDVQAIATGDVDGDGDVDFALGGLDTGVVVFDNRGLFLVPQVVGTPGELRRTRALAWLDVDGDGDLDLHCADELDDRLYRNLHRQLRSRRMVTVGGELAVDFALTLAPSATLRVGIVALGFPASMPVTTPFGSFRLQPGVLSMLPLPQFQLGEPVAAVRMAIPPVPALVGTRLAVQGLGDGGDGLRLTGVQVETIRN